MSECFPQNVLLRFGGRCLDRHGILAVPGSRRGSIDLPITFTRSSVGYFLDRDGIIRKAANNGVRDYWPVGLVDSKGRRRHGPLLEGARTNGWATVTEDYTNAAWTKNGCTVSANAHVAPDGVLASADKIVESALNEEHYFDRTIAGMTDNLRTSVWWLIKAAERNWCRIRTFDKASVDRSTFFNLSTGLVGTQNAGHDVWIRPLGLGYYFIAASFVAGTGGGTPHVRIQLALNDNGSAYAGDGTSGLYVWESGVEVDKPFPSHPGSILPNGLARAADAFSLTPNFGPGDLTFLMCMDRPLHGDVAGATDLGLFPNVFSLGSRAGGGSFEASFGKASRDIDAEWWWTAGNNVAKFAGGLPAGSELVYAAQLQAPTTAPKVTLDVTGSGMLSPSGAGAPSDKFGSQTLTIGTGLFSVVFDGMFIRDLRTRAEALAASDA